MLHLLELSHCFTHCSCSTASPASVHRRFAERDQLNNCFTCSSDSVIQVIQLFNCITCSVIPRPIRSVSTFDSSSLTARSVPDPASRVPRSPPRSSPVTMLAARSRRPIRTSRPLARSSAAFRFASLPSLSFVPRLRLSRSSSPGFLVPRLSADRGPHQSSIRDLRFDDVRIARASAAFTFAGRSTRAGAERATRSRGRCCGHVPLCAEREVLSMASISSVPTPSASIESVPTVDASAVGPDAFDRVPHGPPTRGAISPHLSRPHRPLFSVDPTIPSPPHRSVGRRERAKSCTPTVPRRRQHLGRTTE